MPTKDRIEELMEDPVALERLYRQARTAGKRKRLERQLSVALRNHQATFFSQPGRIASISTPQMPRLSHKVDLVQVFVDIGALPSLPVSAAAYSSPYPWATGLLSPFRVQPTLCTGSGGDH